jgi:hypothetical protein
MLLMRRAWSDRAGTWRAKCCSKWPAAAARQPRPVSGRRIRAKWPPPLREALRPSSVSPRRPAAKSNPTQARIQPMSGPGAAFSGGLIGPPPAPGDSRDAAVSAGARPGVAPSESGSGAGREALPSGTTRRGACSPSRRRRGASWSTGTWRGRGSRVGLGSGAGSAAGAPPSAGTRWGAPSPAGTRRAHGRRPGRGGATFRLPVRDAAHARPRARDGAPGHPPGRGRARRPAPVTARTESAPERGWGPHAGSRVRAAPRAAAGSRADCGRRGGFRPRVRRSGGAAQRPSGSPSGPPRRGRHRARPVRPRGPRRKRDVGRTCRSRPSCERSR